MFEVETHGLLRGAGDLFLCSDDIRRFNFVAGFQPPCSLSYRVPIASRPPFKLPSTRNPNAYMPLTENIP